VEAEKTPRTHTEPLPRSLEELVALFKKAIQLPHVEEVRVTSKTFELRRLVADREEVFPKDTEVLDEFDPEFVLSHIELDELPFDPERHPYHNAEIAMRMITSRGYQPRFLVAPEGPWVAAYFDLPEEPPPTHVFGMKVIHDTSDAYHEKLVVIGCNGPYITDAVYGVIIDIGE
jgi:hypothetical protein